jgi:hypothetical protein
MDGLPSTPPSNQLSDDRPEPLLCRPSRVAQVDLVMLSAMNETPLGDEDVQPLDGGTLGRIRPHVHDLGAKILIEPLEPELGEGGEVLLATGLGDGPVDDGAGHHHRGAEGSSWSHGGHGDHMAGDNQALPKGWSTATRASPSLSIRLPASRPAWPSTTTRRRPGGDNRVSAGRAHAGVRRPSARAQDIMHSLSGRRADVCVFRMAV